MSHTVIILEDMPSIRRTVETLISDFDAEANIQWVQRVSDARDLVNARAGNIAYVVVDLLLFTEERQVQGPTFIDWLLSEKHLATIPVLVLTCEEDMIRKVEGLKEYGRNAHRICIVRRTTDSDRRDAEIRTFINNALRSPR